VSRPGKEYDQDGQCPELSDVCWKVWEGRDKADSGRGTSEIVQIFTLEIRYFWLKDITYPNPLSPDDQRLSVETSGNTDCQASL